MFLSCRSSEQAGRVLEKALKACRKAMTGNEPAQVPAMLHQLISFAERTDLRSTLAQVRKLVVHVTLLCRNPRPTLRLGGQ